jgi:hypothetical protein
MRVKLFSEANELTNVRYNLFDNDGRRINRGVFYTELREDMLVKYYTDLQPGVYEFVVVGSYLDKNPSEYNLFIDFDAVQRMDENLLTEGHNTVKIINLFDKEKKYNISAEILGYVKKDNVSFSGGDEKTLPFIFQENETGKRIDLLMSKTDYNKLTDFAFLVLDEDGSAVKQTALGYQFGSLELSNVYTGRKELTMKFVPGFAHSESKLTLNVKNYTTVNTPVPVSVKPSSLVLYPSVINELDLTCSAPEFEIPQDSKVYGKLYFKCTTSGNTELEIPLYFNF